MQSHRRPTSLRKMKHARRAKLCKKVSDNKSSILKLQMIFNNDKDELD